MKERKQNYISLDSKIVFDKFLKIREDKLQLPDGKMMDYLTLEIPDIISVVVWRNKKLTLIGQYRHTIGKYIFDLPSGYMDKGKETPVETAIRECQEEIGLKPTSIKHIYSAAVWAGISKAMHNVFFADKFENNKLEEEETEFLDEKEFTLEQFEAMIKKGDVEESTIAAVLAVKNLGLLK